MLLKPRQLEILEAAGNILNQEGISGLTMKNIAKRVGFAESALYRHYASKEEIIAGLLDYLHQSMAERLPLIASMEEIHPAIRLKRLLESQIDYLAQHPCFLVAIFSDGLLKYSPLIQESMQRTMSLMCRSMLRIIQDGQKDQVFIEQIAADELVQILMGAFRLRMLQWRMDDFGFDLKTSGNQHIESLILLISKK